MAKDRNSHINYGVLLLVDELLLSTLYVSRRQLEHPILENPVIPLLD